MSKFCFLLYDSTRLFSKKTVAFHNLAYTGCDQFLLILIRILVCKNAFCCYFVTHSLNEVMFPFMFAGLLGGPL